MGKSKKSHCRKLEIENDDEISGNEEKSQSRSLSPASYFKMSHAFSRKKPVKRSRLDPNSEDRDAEDRETLNPTIEKVYQTIDCNGVDVKFPYTPYPSQVALMLKLISAAKTGDSALLESPTGTGKTLALLCSSLAWQQNFEEKKMERVREEKNKFQLDQERNEMRTIITKEDAKKEEDETDLGFCISTTPTAYEDMMDMTAYSDDEEWDIHKEELDSQSKKPVIYYGTRTHKQILQVVEELRTKTPYTPRIAILGSRQQYCIHPKASKEASCDDACNKLRDQTRRFGARKMGKVIKKVREFSIPPDEKFSFSESEEESETTGAKRRFREKKRIEVDLENVCAYRAGTSTMSHKMNDTRFLSEMRRENDKLEDVNSPVWDIEDLVMAGKKAIGCPYYASRELALNADIVFCLYNYLLYPSIRRAMHISLNGNVFIIDEAHNIEDTARDAASLDLSTNLLDQLGSELHILALKEKLKRHTIMILDLVTALKEFSESKIGFYRVQKDQSKEHHMWRINDFWKNLRFDRSILPGIWDCLEALKAYKTKLNSVGESENLRLPALTDLAERSLDSLFFVLESMVKFDDAYIVTIETLKKSKNISFWCLDSGVAFSNFSRKARSIILTSGTLAPLSTFSSELNTNFGFLHEGEHVIKKNQVWAGAVSVGPKGSVLNGIYQTTQTQVYQDETGAALIGIAKAVPGGILCFLPSYILLNTLVTRWKASGDFDQLGRVKQIFIEPRKTSKAFDSALKNYRDLCKDPGLTGITGPIIFAVFRGKLSEGIDFRDAECRCVVSIGIPYPNFKDIKVALKRDFNDRNQHPRQMANGSTWYNTQAYRAINQALGRCIRHKDDWGSIVFLEHRFTMSQHYQNVSKWVRSSLISSCTYRDVINSLSSFVATHDPSLELQNDVSSSNLVSISNLDSNLTPNSSLTTIPVLAPNHSNSTPSKTDRAHSELKIHNPSDFLLSIEELDDLSDDCIEEVINCLPRESSLIQPLKHAFCNHCKHFLFSTAPSTTLPFEFSSLRFPAQHLQQYSIFKAGPTSSIVPTSLTTPSVRHTIPANTFHDLADGLLYGFLGCPSCPTKTCPDSPLAVRIIFALPNAAKLPHNYSEWIWVHPSLYSQLAF